MTGSLVSSALFDCLDVYCAAGFTSCRTFCGTDCVLLAGFGLSLRRVSEYWTMATNGAALVENMAGITFGVEGRGPPASHTPGESAFLGRTIFVC